MAWLVVLICVQVLIAAAVIVGLKRLLDRELVQAAVEKLQAVSIPEGTKEVVVKYCGPLPAQTEAQIKSVLGRKTPAKIVFQADPELKGGLTVGFGAGSIDFSLSSRLKNFWQ